MTARQTKPRLPASPKATTAAISWRELTRAHDDLHTGLDYIDEVASIIVDAAMNDETLDSKRLFFLAHLSRARPPLRGLRPAAFPEARTR